MEVLREGIPRPETTADRGANDRAPATRPATVARWAALVQSAAGAERATDAALAAAARGKTFSPAELLALQTTVFRYSQTVEIVSRATDRLVGAVKQALSTNV